MRRTYSCKATLLLVASALELSNSFSSRLRVTRFSTNKSLKRLLRQTQLDLAYSDPNPPYLGSVTPSFASLPISPNGATAAPTSTTTQTDDNTHLSFPAANGIHQLKTEDEYQALLQANPEKLVVIKFFATYCRACKEMAPKMMSVVQDEQLRGLPIIWAEFPAQRSTKELFKQLRVITLPTIQFYDGSRGLVENFPCPPNRIPVLKKKLARFVNARVDPVTLQLLEPSTDLLETAPDVATEPRVKRTVIDNELITPEHIDYLRNGMPFFQDLSDDEFDGLLQKAKLLSFNRGDVIMKQGMPGTTFYVIKSGVVEMHVKSRFDDPISTPSEYLGVEVNTLKKFDYFGERSLTTGEPFAASFRVLEKCRCFAFHVDDIPESSILSKKRRASTEFVEQLNQRYVLPEDYTPAYPATPRDECILDLLVRFKQIRQAAKCFEYVMGISEPTWGDSGEIARRNLLVRKLSNAQRSEFNEVFDMVDVRKREGVTLLELRQFMQSARQTKTDQELVDMMSRANLGLNVKHTPTLSISRDEFMGVMAEAEFFNLFKETFQELDPENTGYVRAGDLDDVLGGVRDLISDTTQSTIIDVDDKDMLVDYEQFSKMLLGAAL